MTISRKKAISLLGASEQRFYEASRRGAVDDHGATRLKKFIAQTRKVVDKYRERLEAQVRTARGKDKRAAKATAPRDGAENTRLKTEIFSDILSRFEAALGRAEAREQPGTRARPANKKTPSRATASTKEKAASKLSSATPPLKRDASSRSRALRRAETNEVSVRAHVERAPIAAEQPRKDYIASVRAHVAHASSRGRRNQAKRDNR